MQNKCGKFMQISIRNPVVLANAGVFVLFTWRKLFPCHILSVMEGAFNLADAFAEC